MKPHVTFSITRKEMFEAALILAVVLLALIALFGFLAVKLSGGSGVFLIMLFFVIVGICDRVYWMVSEEMEFAHKLAIGKA